MSLRASARERARVLAMAAALASMPGGAILVACADDENANVENPPAQTPIPAVDGGSQDADAALEDPGEPCTPDSLCPNGLFEPHTPGGPLELLTRISVIRGRSANDVWAAGSGGAAGHFDGTTWTRSDAASVESLNGLWLRASGEVAIASLLSAYTRGIVVDGGTTPSSGGWLHHELEPPPEAAFDSRRLTSAWSTGDAEWLWCTTLSNPGVNGLWRFRVEPTTHAVEIAAAAPGGACDVLGCGEMTSVHGASPDDLWAVGYRGAVLRITDAQSETPKSRAFDSQTWTALNGVWAASSTDAWAVGGNGVIRRYTGHSSSWDIVSDVPTTERLNAVWGTSSADVWVVGDSAVVLHYDGKAWSKVAVGGVGNRRPNLYTVWSASPGHVWIGGNGVLLSLGGKS